MPSETPWWVTVLLVPASIALYRLVEKFGPSIFSSRTKREEKELEARIAQNTKREDREWQESNQALEILREALAWMREDFKEIERSIKSLESKMDRHSNVITGLNITQTVTVDEIRSVGARVQSLLAYLSQPESKHENVAIRKVGNGESS